MRHLSRLELSEVAAAAFTKYQLDEGAWLLISPLGDMWASKDPEELLTVLKRNENDLPLYQED